MKSIATILLSCSVILGFAQAEMFIPSDTVYIGPSRDFKSPQEYFSEEKTNVQIFIDSGTYYVGDFFYVHGDHIIVEPHNGRVNLYCEQLYANVLWVSGEHIIVRGFHMKHFEPGGMQSQNCSGRVVGFDMAHNCTIEICDLNGCGLAAIHDNLGNSNILARNNHMHNNSVGAYTDINGGVWQEEVDDHPVFTFSNNIIENNGPNRVREADTLTIADMDSTQLIEFIPVVEDYIFNGYGTCLPIFEDTLICEDCPLENVEVVGYIGPHGSFELLDVTNGTIECDSSSQDILKECMKDYFIGYVSFSAFQKVYVRFTFSDISTCD